MCIKARGISIQNSATSKFSSRYHCKKMEEKNETTKYCANMQKIFVSVVLISWITNLETVSPSRYLYTSVKLGTSVLSNDFLDDCYKKFEREEVCELKKGKHWI